MQPRQLTAWVLLGQLLLGCSLLPPSQAVDVQEGQQQHTLKPTQTGDPAGRASTAHTRPKVIFDHDGGIDDYVTLTLLHQAVQRGTIDLLAVTILDADCFAAIAANTSLKLLHTLGTPHVPVAVSTLTGVNPFPDDWRWAGIGVDVLPQLNDFPPGQDWQAQVVQQPGEEFLAQLIASQQEPVTILASGPLTNIAYALKTHGSAVASKIKEVWWMGGALHVPGNVKFPGHDGSAEWNAFWDPPAVGTLWASDVPLVVVPLDATNHVPVTADLLYRFGPQLRWQYSMLVGTIWSRVATWAHEREENEVYFAWDTLTATCFLNPGICKRVDGIETHVAVSGISQGRTIVTQANSSTACVSAAGVGAAGAGGSAGLECPGLTASLSRSRAVSAIMHVEAEDFYAYLLEALRL